MRAQPTPERPRGRSGVLLWLFPLTVVAACDALGGGATVQLDSAEVSLGGGAEVHEVRITGAGATDSIAPSTVEAEPGDAVRFVVADRRTHAPSFRVEQLEAPLRQYLEQTQQLRGPPLVNEDAAWVVFLEEAPPGRYPFYCRSHDAGGVLVVRSTR